MSDQTRIQTLGPEDPNAPARSKTYAIGGLILAAIPVLVTFNVLSQEQASSLIETYSAIGGLLGAFGFGFAAWKTRTQVNNGTFDKAPAEPIRDAFQAIDALEARAAQAVANTKAQVADGIAVIQGAASLIPGGAAVTGAVFSGPVGDLVQGVLDNDATATQ